MTRFYMILVFLGISTSLLAQNNSDTIKNVRICPPGSSKLLPPQPSIYLVVDGSEILIDSLITSKFNPDHIETISVKKDSASLKKYGTANGVVLIYPKKEFLPIYREKIIN